MATKKILVATTAEMEQSISKFVQLGFAVANKTPTSALLVKKKEFSIAAAVLGLLICLVGLLVYAIIFAMQKDEYVEIALNAAPTAPVLQQQPVRQISDARPRPPEYKPKTMIHCSCNHCSGEMQFNEDGFDPSNPPIILCPHCGLETQLYIPQSTE